MDKFFVLKEKMGNGQGVMIDVEMLSFTTATTKTEIC